MNPALGCDCAPIRYFESFRRLEYGGSFRPQTGSGRCGCGEVMVLERLISCICMRRSERDRGVFSLVVSAALPPRPRRFESCGVLCLETSKRQRGSCEPGRGIKHCSACSMKGAERRTRLIFAAVPPRSS